MAELQCPFKTKEGGIIASSNETVAVLVLFENFQSGGYRIPLSLLVPKLMLVPPQLTRSGPQLPIQRAELDGFGDVVADDFFGLGQVGDGARHLEHAVVSARAEVQVAHGEFEQFEG